MTVQATHKQIINDILFQDFTEINFIFCDASSIYR